MNLQKNFQVATASCETRYRADGNDSIKNPFAKGSDIRHISIVVLTRNRASDCAVTEAGDAVAGGSP